MRISISDGDNIVVMAEVSLVDGISGDDQYTIQTDPMIQEDMPLRSAGVKFRDRGNVKTTVQFQVRRLFATYLDSELFCLDHGGQVPKIGLVTFEAGNASEGIGKRYLVNAAIRSIPISRIGVSPSVRYTITGGVMLKEPVETD